MEDMSKYNHLSALGATIINFSVTAASSLVIISQIYLLLDKFGEVLQFHK